MSSKPNVSYLITYIQNNNMNNSEFMKQMIENFTNKKRLTKKQIECLSNSVNNHKYCRNFFNFKAKEIENNTFLTSLNDQFKTKNFLTEKQIQCLKKYETRYDDI